MFSSYEEYQRILKYYVQNLVISLVLKLLEIVFKVIYIVHYNEFFLGKQRKKSL